MTTIGKRIKDRREEIGLSVEELAKKLGKNRATVYRYESNEIENLPITILEPLAKMLQTTPAYLMGWEADFLGGRKLTAEDYADGYADEPTPFEDFERDINRAIYNLMDTPSQKGFSEEVQEAIEFQSEDFRIINEIEFEYTPDGIIQLCKELDNENGILEVIEILELVRIGLNYNKGKTNIHLMHLPSNTVKIPVLGSIPAGLAVEAVEDIIGWEEIPEDWLRGGRDYFGLVVKGDSMYPEYLEGDIVIVRQQNCCDSGDDCVVMIDNTDATLKRVKIFEDGIELEAVNKMHGKKKYVNEEVVNLPVIILGVVVELRRKKK